MIAPRDVAGSVDDQGRHSWGCCCVRNEGRVCEYVVYTDSDDVGWSSRRQRQVAQESVDQDRLGVWPRVDDASIHSRTPTTVNQKLRTCPPFHLLRHYLTAIATSHVAVTI
jgi:hypothetical protein